MRSERTTRYSAVVKRAIIHRFKKEKAPRCYCKTTNWRLFMQIKGLHKNIYRLANYCLQQELLSEQEKLRYKQLGDWEMLKKHRVPDSEIARITGISRATFYRRKACIKHYGSKGLHRRSNRPHNLRKSQISMHIHNIIIDTRLDNPTYGKAKITAILERDHNIKISQSSVGRIISKALKKGEIVRYKSAKYGRRKRQFNKHAQRWIYGMKPQKPGQMIQIDHMSVNKIGKQIKHFQAYDPISKYVYAEIFSQAKSSNAANFLFKLENSLPFPITSIQVDGGSEFMKDFESLCQRKGIPLFVLPPNRPQYNGGVERANRTFREDFYDQVDYFDSIQDARIQLKQALHKYNNFRPHQKLDNLTPIQYINNILGKLSHSI